MRLARAELALLASILKLASCIPTGQSLAADTSSCPGKLGATDVAPSLIVPVSASQPDTQFGTQYSPQITANDICTWFAFDVPPVAAASSTLCALEFLFPNQSQLVSSSYSLSGPGTFLFASVWSDASANGGVSAQTSWNTQPTAADDDEKEYTLVPGTLNVFSAGLCQQSDVYRRLNVRVCSADSALQYFQDNADCPIGLWVKMSKLTARKQ